MSQNVFNLYREQQFEPLKDRANSSYQRASLIERRQSFSTFSNNQVSKPPISGNHLQIKEVYLDITKRLDQKSISYLSKVIPLEEGKENYSNQDPTILLQYIKQICIFLIKCKMELEDQVIQVPTSNEYEILLQKLEADIRQHIKIEHQLRLFAESSQQKYEDCLSEKKELEEKIKVLENQVEELNFYYRSQKEPKLITEPIYNDDSTSKATRKQYTQNESQEQLDSKLQNFIENKAISQEKFNEQNIQQTRNLISQMNISYQERIDKQKEIYCIVKHASQCNSPQRAISNNRSSLQRVNGSSNIQHDNLLKQQSSLNQQVNQNQKYSTIQQGNCIKYRTIDSQARDPQKFKAFYE